MAYNTDYKYNIDNKTSTITFYDDAAELCNYALASNIITISARDEVEVVGPTWGTNKDTKEWFNFLLSCKGRFELSEGLMRIGYRYYIAVAAAGITGYFKVDGLKTLAEWTWIAATDTLTLNARNEIAVNFAEFRSYVQWLLHFQYVIENYGG